MGRGSETTTPEGPGGGAAGALARDAERALARRPLTERELVERLTRRGHAAAAVQREIERLRRAGYVDDFRLGVDFIVARAERLGHGRRRLLGELLRRGIDERTAERAWNSAIEDAGLDPSAGLERRIAVALRRGPRLDERRLRRLYNALIRAGFERAAVEAGLAPHRACGDADGSC